MKTLETFYNYKGYIIRLRSGHCLGFGFSIIKQCENKNSPNGLKNIYLRQKTYNFISEEKLLNEAKNYIDSFSSHLEEKFERNRIKIIEEVK